MYAGAGRGQKRAVDFLALYLKAVINCLAMDTGNRTWVFFKSSSCS